MCEAGRRYTDGSRKKKAPEIHPRKSVSIGDRIERDHGDEMGCQNRVRPIPGEPPVGGPEATLSDEGLDQHPPDDTHDAERDGGRKSRAGDTEQPAPERPEGEPIRKAQKERQHERGQGLQQHIRAVEATGAQAP